MCHIFIESDKVRSPAVAGNVLISLFSQQLMKVKSKGSKLVDQAAATDDFNPKELSAAFPAPPAALPIVTRAITTHLRARGREAY